MTNVVRVAAATILLTYLSNPAFGQANDDKTRRGEWRESIATNPLPKKGCFESSYPNKQWREVPCIKCGEAFRLNSRRNELKGYNNPPDWFFWNSWLG